MFLFAASGDLQKKTEAFKSVTFLQRTYQSYGSRIISSVFQVTLILTTRPGLYLWKFKFMRERMSVFSVYFN